MDPKQLVPEEAGAVIDAPDDQAVEMERELVEATNNGWVEGDPLDQPDNRRRCAPMASAADVVAVANREVGVVERPTNCTKYGAWYGVDGQPWCAMFVSWCFDQAEAAKLVAASCAKGFAYCPAGAGWYQKRGAWGTPREWARSSSSGFRADRVGFTTSAS